ncbi:hypothetical protein LTR27_001556 [Elasticomyces elasticus]|nr:hypothetical protein LTR27_001556 [Elasticomyces elasticus]
MASRSDARGGKQITTHRAGTRQAARRSVPPVLHAQQVPQVPAVGLEFWLSIDYGTKKMAAAVAVKQPGIDIAEHDIKLVHFNDRDYYAPQKAAWAANGDFYWDYGVQKAIDEGLIGSGHVIDFWKLLLYQDHSTSALAERIREQLRNARRTLDELITTHFKHIFTAVRQWVLSRGILMQHSQEVIEAMPCKVLLSVPKLWETPKIEVMTSAIKRAGFHGVEVILEPHSVVGYFANSMKHVMHKLKVGDLMLLADIGGGTGDFTTVELEGPLSDGAIVKLRGVAASNGTLWGSQLVNEQCIKYLQEEAMEQYGITGWKYLCNNVLGITPAEAVSQVNDSFDDIKAKFTSTNSRPKMITIVGINNAHWGRMC